MKEMRVRLEHLHKTDPGDGPCIYTTSSRYLDIDHVEAEDDNTLTFVVIEGET